MIEGVGRRGRDPKESKDVGEREGMAKKEEEKGCERRRYRQLKRVCVGGAKAERKEIGGREERRNRQTDGDR